MKIIIHAGYPKCASSHLQSLLEIRERDGGLASLGYCYPLETVEAVGGRNGHLLLDYLTYGTEASLQALIHQITKSRINFIYSDENAIFVLYLDKIQRLLRNLSENVQFLIVTAIREPSQWLLSDYYQHIKTSVHSIKFYEHVLIKESQMLVDYEKFYFSRFKNTNPDSVRVVACDHSNLVSCVESLVGAPAGFLEDLPSSGINSNKSPSASVIEAMRIASLLGVVDNSEARKLLESTITEDCLNQERLELMAYLKEKYSNYRATIKGLDYVDFYEK